MKNVVLAVLIGVVLMILVMEAGLRISGQYRTYSERNGQGYITYYGQTSPDWYWTYQLSDTFELDHGEFSYTYATNAYGLREREIPGADSQRLRVFVFGDSFTDGVGADYDSSWPRELERLLVRDGLDAEVFNAGVSGSDPFYSHILLRDRFLALRPTHVIFQTNDNDLHDYMYRSGFERFRADGTSRNLPAPRWHAAYRHFHLARWFIERALGYDKDLIRVKDRKARFTEAITAIRQCMDSTETLCRGNDVRFLMLTHVPPAILCSDANTLDVQSYENMSYDYPVVFLEERLRQAIRPEGCLDFYWEKDGHFNAKGYTVMGRAVYDAVREECPGFWNRRQ